MAVAVMRTWLDVNGLVAAVIRLLNEGQTMDTAVEQVLDVADLDESITRALLERGLRAAVYRADSDARRVPSPSRSRPAGSSSRRGQQVAPGKPSEWLAYAAIYPALARVVYFDIAGVRKSLFDFVAADWLSMVDRLQTTRKNAALREAAARLALQMLDQRQVETIRDLPAKDIKQLDETIAKAWKR